jgi:hypothetical protein
MNENDLSDLVSKTKKSGGSKTKRTRAKSARKQPLQKKTSSVKNKIWLSPGTPRS